ncbi:hypothetical protein FGU46_03360 [Methanobacterium sp. CWC-01]|uniref:hypothetical protein n=1 Tax=Methanobacterium aridiramus TaxID=2584467 RepID=UPI0025753CB0|nr:hypothetical protein [Methanobacterium sp. CWC-01]WJI09198.1 hypothetical protein FGU46_03360 [Methanobacterium sp. CWC-01]
MILHESIVVAQLNDDITILGDEHGQSLPNEVINVLKYICKNFASYILVDNAFIQFLYRELRKIRVEYGRRNLERQIEDISPLFREDPELTVFSVLDGEDLYDLE